MLQKRSDSPRLIWLAPNLAAGLGFSTIFSPHKNPNESDFRGFWEKQVKLVGCGKC